MFLRISSVALAVSLLAACGAATETPEPEGDTVECAIGAGSEFSAVCTLEEVSSSEFIIHHPDGGFRRFQFDEDGKLAASDGAEPVLEERIRVYEGTWEFALEIDRYRVDGALLDQYR